MNGFYILISVGSAIAIILTFVLNKFFGKRAIIRYIPAIIAGLAVIGFYIKSAYFSSGFEDLGYIILALMACVIFFVSFVTAFIIGIIQRNRNNQN